MRRLAAILLGSAALAAASREARAAEPPRAVRLHYDHAARCPDEQEFRDALISHAHRDLFDAGAAAQLDVKLASTDRGYRGTAELRDADGAVAWTIALGPVPRDCSAVMNALSLSIATKLDPPVLPRRPPSPPPAPPQAPAPCVMPKPPLPTPCPPTPCAAPKAAPPPRPRFELRLGASGGVAFGAVPGPAGFFALDFAVRPRSLPVAFGVQARVVTPVAVDVPGTTLGISRYTGALFACAHFLRYLGACALGEAGVLRAVTSQDDILARPYGALGGRVIFEYPGPLGILLRLSVEGLGKLTKSNFNQRPLMRAPDLRAPDWQAPAASATITGGLVYIFEAP